jgi:lipopolysaccharide transport system ATP-binding protein
MSDTVIQIENVSKLYHIGERKPYKTLRESLMKALTSPSRLARQATKPPLIPPGEREIWALRDVSFQVKQGEVVGIIGRNGAGKSTLLKVLSRITEPTAGRIVIRGRVGSLLEVGTGFHPELSGRENIFLNGTILGMRRAEIVKKFDEIVAFAEIGTFIDTPVKHFSSGMYMRLAFAVAAHLQPEILIVDEVLAVGDVQFQQKCLGKMTEVAKQGRTVLFVSHNMGAVMRLCRHAVMLESGTLKRIGEVSEVVREYLSQHSENGAEIDLRRFPGRSGTGELRFESARLLSATGSPIAEFSIGDDIQVEFVVRKHRTVGSLTFAVELATSDGLPLANMVDFDSGFAVPQFAERAVIRVRLRDVRFYPGSYQLGLFVGSMAGRDTYDHVQSCLKFEMIGGGHLTSRTLPRGAGLLFLTPRWESSCVES